MDYQNEADEDASRPPEQINAAIRQQDSVLLSKAPFLSLPVLGYFILSAALTASWHFFSPVPCSKRLKWLRLDYLLHLWFASVAHEAGHYLGLSRVNDNTNLMNPSVPNGGILTAGQGNNMKDHCFVNG
jgi:hypothetical protein